MMTAMRQSTPLVWSAILGLVAIVGTYGLACVFPFAAVAAIAAITLPGVQAFLLIAAVWAANQAVGFGLMDYAAGNDALLWSGFIGAGALFAGAAARAVYGVHHRIVAARAVAALAASVVAYQSVMFAGAWALAGFASSTPAIVATIVRNDFIWFGALLAIRYVLKAGFPRLFGPAVPTLS